MLWQKNFYPKNFKTIQLCEQRAYVFHKYTNTFLKKTKISEHLDSQDPQQRFLPNLEMGKIIITKKHTQQNAH